MCSLAQHSIVKAAKGEIGRKQMRRGPNRIKYTGTAAERKLNVKYRGALIRYNAQINKIDKHREVHGYLEALPEGAIWVQ